MNAILELGRICLRESSGLKLWIALLITGGAWTGGVEAADASESDSTKPSFILVQGAGGEEASQTKFNTWVDKWLATAKLGQARVTLIGRDSTNALRSLEQLRTALSHEPKEGPADLWIVLIGHGTFNGREAKFNLTGGDLSAVELATLLQPFRRPGLSTGPEDCSPTVSDPVRRRLPWMLERPTQGRTTP